MTKRRYTGILARRIPENDEAARQEAMEALGALYGVAAPESVDPLTAALLAAHVPAFRPQKPPSKQARSRSGRKRKLSLKEVFLASAEVMKLRRKGIKRTRACELVWRKKYSQRCCLGTFVQNVMPYTVWGPRIGATAEEIAAAEKGREEAIADVNKMVDEIGVKLGASPEQIEAFRMKLNLEQVRERILMRIEKDRCFHSKHRTRSGRS